MTRSLTALLVAACLLPACGSDDADSGSGAPDPNDRRALALDCIVNEKGIEAQLSGDNAIQVGDDPDTEPRVEFYVTSGEAEGRQYAGNAQGAEHIGNALLFVRGGSDELLDELEDCLQDL